MTSSTEAALVLPSYGAGGAERVVLNLAGGLVARGWAVRLLVLDPRGPLRTAVPDGVRPVLLGARRARWETVRLVRELRSRPADLVFGSQTHINVLLSLLRPSLPDRTRLVLREPNLRPVDERDPRRERRVGRLLGRADLVLASSEAMRTHLRTTVGERAPIRVLANPVDVPHLRTLAARGTPVGVPGGLVSVGRLNGQKAQADLIDALASSGRDAPPLTILGDGPLRAELEERVRRTGLTDRVHLTGRIDDPATLAATVAAADLLVHPARFDGMPNAVLEALALGTPVLATTDLAVLAELAEEVGPRALRRVPRDELGPALTTGGPSGGPVPRPSLLPERFHVDAVVVALLDALDGLGRARGA